MALELKLALLAFWFYARSVRNNDISLSFLVVQLTAVLRVMIMLMMLKVMKKHCN